MMKKRRRRRLSGKFIERLESRRVLDAAFQWSEFDRRLGDNPNGSGSVDMDTILAADGSVYLTTEDVEGIRNVRKIPASQFEPNATIPPSLPIVRAELAALTSFDVNGSGLVAALHVSEELDGSVVSRGNTQSDIEYLVIDQFEPSAGIGRGTSPVPTHATTHAKFEVEFSDDRFLDANTLVDSKVIFDGPSGTLVGQVGAKRIGSSTIVVEYLVGAPDGRWDHNDNGSYTVKVLEAAVKDLAGNPIPDKTLDTFTLNFADDESTEVTSVTASGGTTSDPIDPGHQFILDNSVEFINRADLEIGGEVDFTYFQSVALTEDGDVMLNLWAQGGDEYLARWSDNDVSVKYFSDQLPASDVVFFDFQSSYMDIAHDGTIVARAGEQILRISADLGSTEVIADTATFGAPGGTVTADFADVAISEDGQVITFLVHVPSPLFLNLGGRFEATLASNPFSLMIFSYDVASGTTTRIIGSDGDAFLDPGERWAATSENLILDQTSESSLIAGLADVVIPPANVPAFSAGRNYWIAYRQVNSYQESRFYGLSSQWIAADRLMMRNVVHLDDGTVEIGPPVLVFARKTEEPFFRSIPDFELIVLPDGEFRATVTTSEPTANFETAIARQMALGAIPEFDDTLKDDPSRRHELLEVAARGVAYAEVRDPENDYARGTVLEGGYVITGSHVDEDSNGGFVAVEIQPLQTGGTPILAFQGSNANDLLTADIEARGIGYDQFMSNRDWVAEWVEEYQSRFQHAPTFVGHSLGGALAQWFVTSVMSDTEAMLEEVVTFNAPGIGAQDVAEIGSQAKSRVDKVTHFIVSGDFVSLAGERFVEGMDTDITLVNVSDQLILFVKDLLDSSKTNLPRHTSPILTDSLYNDGELVPKLLDQEHVPISIERLNHPEFNYMHDGEYRDFVYKLYTESGQLSQHFVARQRAEEFRKRFLSSTDPIGVESSFLINLLLGLSISTSLKDVLSAIVQSATELSEFARPVYVSVNFESLNPWQNGMEFVSYNYDQKRLLVPYGTPLVVATRNDVEEVVLKRKGSGEVDWIQMPDFPSNHITVATPLRVMNSNADIPGGQYTLRSRNSTSGVTTHLAIIENRRLQPQRSGVRVGSQGVDAKYLMHSTTKLMTRFPQFQWESDVSEDLVAVRRHDENWQLYVNGNWESFVPEIDDVLVGTVDVAKQTAQPMKGLYEWVGNMTTGFFAGDFTPGEVRLDGTETLLVPILGAHLVTFDIDTLTNPIQANDVNADGNVTPGDALAVINHLAVTNRGDNAGGSLMFHDVNADNNVSPIDALRVINALEADRMEPERTGVEIPRRSATHSVAAIANPSTPSSIDRESHDAVMRNVSHFVAPRLLRVQTENDERIDTVGFLTRKEKTELASTATMGAPSDETQNVGRDRSPVATDSIVSDAELLADVQDAIFRQLA